MGLITHVPRNMAAKNTALVVTMMMRTASKILWEREEGRGREGGRERREEGREGGREGGRGGRKGGREYNPLCTPTGGCTKDFSIGTHLPLSSHISRKRVKLYCTHRFIGTSICVFFSGGRPSGR